jgi:hypothetical protein
MNKWAKRPAAVPLTEREIAQRRYLEAVDVVEAYKVQLSIRRRHARDYDRPEYHDRVSECLAHLEAAEAQQAHAWTELDYFNKERAAALATLHG